MSPPGFDTKAYGNVVQLSAPSASGPTLTLIEKGLHISAIKFKDVNGQEHDIIVGSDDPTHYVDEKKFRHSLIGRYCNRLPAEKPLTLPSSEESISLPSYPSKGVCLHGGPKGWDQKVLERVDLTTSKSTLFSEKEVAFLRKQEGQGSAGVWTLTSADGEEGHSGTVVCEIAIATLPASATSEVGQIVIVYRAKLLDKPSTALNLTHHWGFNLAASGISKGQPVPAQDIGISDHVLSIKSKNILNLDSTSLPTGTLLSLSKDTAKIKDFSMTGGKPIGHPGKEYPTALKGGVEAVSEQGHRGDGYDDYWVFDREGKKDVVVDGVDGLDVFADIAADKEIVASLSSPQTGVSISFTSNQPGLQAWSGDGAFDGSDARKTLHGGKSVRNANDGYVSSAPPGLAMEFHAVYGAWMHPELQRLGWDTVLKKGEIYNNWVKMSICSE